jgi:adenine-specific DNA-methyltransferase
MCETTVQHINHLTVPRTEGIKYAGSKLRIIPYIVQIAGELEGVRTVLDGFSGSTRVSQAFAQMGYNTTASDISHWSEVFASCYLLSKQPDSYYHEILDHLNHLEGYDGWFTEYYGATEANRKKPFQLKNTRKLDAVRDEIDKLKLPFEDQAVLLTSLIYALDKVDSTLGHFVSYLSEWSARSYKNLRLQLPQRFEATGQNRVVRDDIFNVVGSNAYDLAYFDPPYGSNNHKMPPSRVRYASYYHFWKTVILNDKPDLFGKANRRTDTRDMHSPSVFEEYRKNADGKFIALGAIDELIRQTRARFILLSYSSGGRVTRQELSDILNSSGKILKIMDIDFRKNVMAQMRWTNEWSSKELKHHEYLFLMEKKL